MSSLGSQLSCNMIQCLSSRRDLIPAIQAAWDKLSLAGAMITKYCLCRPSGS
jgi:hypothetical protein